MQQFVHRILIIVLVVCGTDVFAQAQYGWIQKAGFPGPARHRATAAAAGNRGYMGLGHINSVVDVLFDDWFEYDPGTDSWTQKANYPGGPRLHAASFVIDNIIYVGTGRDVNASLHKDFWKYNPVTNTWAAVASYPGAGRRGAVGFTINGLGYVGTGSYHSNFYRYDPSNDSWTQIQSLPGTGRISAVGFAINDKGYIGTGDESGPLNDLWQYDPAFDTWTQMANLPGLPRMEAGGFVLNGKGYIGTGDDFSSGNNYQDFWCYDPSTNAWMQVTDFAGAARRYLSCFTIGNRAYAGLGTSGMNYADFWEYGSISGVEENSGFTFSVYPMPVTEQSMVQFSSAVSDAKMELTDINGKLVAKHESISGSQFRLERNGLPDGVYFLRVEENGKLLSIQKIIFGR
jgi:N-acetylneuraminic acid mutarotase